MINKKSITHSMYNKITDVVFYINTGYVLKFNTVLNRVNKNNEIINYHSEVSYTSKDNVNLININRKFDYYLSIESLIKNEETGLRDFIKITQNDIYFLKHKMNVVADLFTDKDNVLFTRKDNKIILVDNSIYVILELYGGKKMEFRPCVYYSNISNEQFIGVRIYYEDFSFFVSIASFLALKDIIDNFNMYQSAQMMLAYMDRPEYGYNLNDYSTGYETVNKFLV